jgi:hypothetical protein
MELVCLAVAIKRCKTGGKLQARISIVTGAADATVSTLTEARFAVSAALGALAAVCSV